MSEPGGKCTNPNGKGSKSRILRFLLDNQGRVLEWQEIREAAGGVEQWSRRMRELRDEEGYQILSHKDRADLHPGQYLMETDVQRPALPRDISAGTRAYVYERNGYTCQMCGVAAGDPDPLGGPRKVRLTLGHIIDKSKGGTDDASNLRAVCTACNQGLTNAGPQKPDRIQLVSQVRRATIDDQLYLLEWLNTKFGKLAGDTKKPKQ
jgi:hypothetical protein